MKTGIYPWVAFHPWVAFGEPAEFVFNRGSAVLEVVVAILYSKK
jgi:hypothetical protein